MLISHLKEIQNLRMSEVRNRPVNCEKMVIIGGMVIVRLANNKWWTSWHNFSKFGYQQGGQTDQQRKLLTGLVKLGLISNDVVQQHLEVCEQEKAKMERHYALKSLHGACKELGIKVPKSVAAEAETASTTDYH